MNDSLVTSAKGRAAITSREGNILKAYDDGTGTLTIGVGHTSAAGAPTVTRGMVITAAQSDAILESDLHAVEKSIRSLVKVALNQSQFDALVSFVFNVGSGNFSGSTLLRKLNAGDFSGAAEQFGVWTKAGGKTMQGLVTRRASEKAQFLSDSQPASTPAPAPKPAPAPVQVPAPLPSQPAQPAPNVNWLSALISVLVSAFKGERI